MITAKDLASRFHAFRNVRFSEPDMGTASMMKEFCWIAVFRIAN